MNVHVSLPSTFNRHFLDTHPDTWEGPQIEEGCYVGGFKIKET